MTFREKNLVKVILSEPVAIIYNIYALDKDWHCVFRALCAAPTTAKNTDNIDIFEPQYDYPRVKMTVHFCAFNART